MTLAEKIWRKVSIDVSGCWLWSGARSSSGYGLINHVVDGQRRTVGVHRAVWELMYGPITDGLFVLHRCDVKLCVRPLHLRLGTQEQNMMDMRHRWRGKRHDHGHFYGLINHRTH